MTKKPSKANLALIFFIAIFLLSFYAQIAYQADMQSNYFPTYYVRADGLTVKPEKYFILSNPDQYVLRAINGESVFVRQTDTQIYDLERQHDTSNVEYNGSYYAIWIAFVDAFPPSTLPLILAGFVISILTIVIISIFQVAKHFKQQKKNFLSQQTHFKQGQNI